MANEQINDQTAKPTPDGTENAVIQEAAGGAGSYKRTTLQAIADLATGGGVTDADYLVGTAHAGLSAEIVVGTSPGGELGGTWASPTVDATHSGSSHASIQAAAEATAANASNLTSGTVNIARLPLDADLATFSVPASTTISSFIAATLDETTVGAFLTALGIDADLATLAVPASTTISSFVAGALDETTIGAFLTALGLDADLATLALPASTTISSFGASLVDDANAAAAIATLGLDADIATLALPASTTISAFGATLVDDANAAAAIATLGLDADIATLSLPASTTITAAAATVLDDASTAAMLTTLGAQPVDSDLTTIAGLTATTDNIIQSVGSAWASRTPAQVKAALAITTADVSTLDTSLGSLNTQAMLAAAKQAAIYAANAGYYIGAGLDYTPSSTAGKMDRTSGVGLFGPVEGTGGTSATAIGSDVATLGASLTAGQEMWVTFEIGSTGTTFQTAGSAATAGSAVIPDTTAGRVVVGWMYIPFAAVALNAVDELLTTANSKAKFIDARVVRPGPSITGWSYDQNTWTFVSSTTGAGNGLITYKVTGVDVTGYLTPGTKVSWDDGTNTPGYGVIATSTFSTDTTITLVKQSIFVMANATIKYPRYSRVEAPVGFPASFPWLPTLSGWSSDPTTTVYLWALMGTTSIMLMVRQATAGTSNATSHTITLPVTARTEAAMVWSNTGRAQDNGTNQTGLIAVLSAGTTCLLNGIIATSTNTASGNSQFYSGNVVYQFTV